MQYLITRNLNLNAPSHIISLLFLHCQYSLPNDDVAICYVVYRFSNYVASIPSPIIYLFNTAFKMLNGVKK